jgi:hypothetical protein
LHIATVVGSSAVQEDACNVAALKGCLEDSLGLGEAGVVAGVAADEGDVADGDVGGVGEVGDEDVALQLLHTHASDQLAQPQITSARGLFLGQRPSSMARRLRCVPGLRRRASAAAGPGPAPPSSCSRA